LLIMTFYCLIKRTALCTTHDMGLPLIEQKLEWRLWPNFLCLWSWYTFKYWYRKSPNSVRISQTQIVIHDPFHIYGTVRVRNFQFSTHIDNRDTNDKNAKL